VLFLLARLATIKKQNRLYGKRDMARAERLKEIVANEALLWGNGVADTYHAAAGRAMDDQWRRMIWPMLQRNGVDVSQTVELACGFGRNSRKLLEAGSRSLTLVDVNPDNIAYCRQHIQPLGNVSLVQNNGLDLSALGDGKFTLVYTFDSMVHFDLELVISYVAEFARILQPGGLAFIHHSNFTGSPGSDFRQNPHWRNFMSAMIMRHIAFRNKFEVAEQQIISWGGVSGLDCLSLLRRLPA